MNKEKLEKIYFKIIEWGTYLALLTPLVFFRGYFHLFNLPKMFFFGTVVSFIFIVYVLLAVFNSSYRPKITPLTLAVSVFLVVLTLTSITGINLEKSFFGTFARGGGLLAFFHLFAFYIILTSCFKERKYWERILTVSITVCVFVSFSVLFIGMGGGTISNPSFLSAYLLFHLFFALMFLVIKTGRARIFYGLAFAVFLFFLFSNPQAFTKGAVAAFFFGIIVLVFGCLFYSNKRKAAFLLFLALILLALGLVLSLQFDFARERASEFWESGSVQSRATVWQISWQGWQERFWLGWGLENFTVPFARHFNPQIALSDDNWFDRAHNIVLDVGVASGIFGVLSYLAIFCLAFFGLAKKLLLKDVKEKNAVIYFTIIALLAAYFFQNLWVFDTISTYLIFFLSLAFVNFLIYPSKESVGRKAGFWPVSAGAVLIFLTILAFYFGGIQPLRASKLIGKGPIRPPEEFIPAFEKAFEIFPLAGIEGSMYLSCGISGLAEKEDQDKELIYQGFELAEKHLKKAIMQNPSDCRLQLILGEHYNAFYELSGEKEKLALAQEYLEKALDLSPNLQKTYFALSQTSFLQGEQEKALKLLEKAKELEPRYKMAIWHLLKGYAKAGEYELALAELRLLEKMELTCRDAEASMGARRIFDEAGQSLEVFIPLFEKGVEDNPEKLCFWLDLVGAYLAAGEKEKARQALEDWPDF